jgi:hypothetical protein
VVGAMEVARAQITARPPRLTPGVVNIFRHDWAYSSAKATQQLGYRVTPLEEGLKMTLQTRHG